MTRGTEFLFDHDLTLMATSRASMQRQNEQGDSRHNVAHLYARLAERIRDGKPASPRFAAAVARHRLLEAIIQASETGSKQAL